MRSAPGCHRTQDRRSQQRPEGSRAHLHRGDVQAGDHDTGRGHGCCHRASRTREPRGLGKDDTGETTSLYATEEGVRTRRIRRIDLSVDRHRRRGEEVPRHRVAVGDGERGRPAEPCPERIRVRHAAAKADDRGRCDCRARRKRRRSGRPLATEVRRDRERRRVRRLDTDCLLGGRLREHAGGDVQLPLIALLAPARHQQRGLGEGSRDVRGTGDRDQELREHGRRGHGPAAGWIGSARPSPT